MTAKRAAKPTRSKLAPSGGVLRAALELLLLLVCGVSLLYFTPRTYRAVRTAMRSLDVPRVTDEATLRAADLGAWRRAAAVGVPDYPRMVEGEGGARYFRLAAIPEGLLVKAKGVSAPKELEEVLSPREFDGPTVRLAELPEGGLLAEKFKARFRLRLSPETVVLLSGEKKAFPYAEAALNALALVGFLLLVERRAGA